MEKIPLNNIIQILYFCDNNSKFRFISTNKYLNNLSNNDLIWKQIALQLGEKSISITKSYFKKIFNPNFIVRNKNNLHQNYANPKKKIMIKKRVCNYEFTPVYDIYEIENTNNIILIDSQNNKMLLNLEYGFFTFYLDFGKFNKNFYLPQSNKLFFCNQDNLKIIDVNLIINKFTTKKIDTNSEIIQEIKPEKLYKHTYSIDDFIEIKQNKFFLIYCSFQFLSICLFDISDMNDIKFIKESSFSDFKIQNIDYYWATLCDNLLYIFASDILIFDVERFEFIKKIELDNNNKFYLKKMYIPKKSNQNFVNSLIEYFKNENSEQQISKILKYANYGSILSKSIVFGDNKPLLLLFYSTNYPKYKKVISDIYFFDLNNRNVSIKKFIFSKICKIVGFNIINNNLLIIINESCSSYKEYLLIYDFN